MREPGGRRLLGELVQVEEVDGPPAGAAEVAVGDGEEAAAAGAEEHVQV